jgi:hypothetical protein
MVRLTLIARQRDGLPLAEGLDNDKDRDLTISKQQAKVRVRLCVASARRYASNDTFTADPASQAGWLFQSQLAPKHLQTSHALSIHPGKGCF